MSVPQHFPQPFGFSPRPRRAAWYNPTSQHTHSNSPCPFLQTANPDDLRRLLHLIGLFVSSFGVRSGLCGPALRGRAPPACEDSSLRNCPCPRLLCTFLELTGLRSVRHTLHIKQSLEELSSSLCFLCVFLLLESRAVCPRRY